MKSRFPALAASLAASLTLAATLSGGADRAGAQSLADIVRAEILPGWRTEQGTHMAALRLELAQGWKTYWRSPGDAGIPPEFDWHGSDNLRSVRLHWPVPEVFDFAGMQTIGYARELVLPIEIQPQRPGQPIALSATLDFGVCKDICVPASLALSAPLPATGKVDARIRRALAQRPKTAREAGVSQHSCSFAQGRQGLEVTADITLPALGGAETVVIETDVPGLWVAEARSARHGGRLTAQTEFVAANRQPVAVNRSGLTVTVLGGGRAVEISGCPAP